MLNFIFPHDSIKADVVISSDWKRTKSLEDLKLLFQIHGLDTCITDIAPYEMFSSKWEDIMSYLNNYPDIGSYVVIDDLDMEKYFRGHFVYTGKSSRLENEALLRAERILDYGPWWSDLYVSKTNVKGTDLITDHYKKVIYLDGNRGRDYSIIILALWIWKLCVAKLSGR